MRHGGTEGRGAMFEKILIAVIGALVGSLVGRLIMNPGWVGHLVFLTAGALVFSLVDRWRKAASADHHHQARR
jgi:uncharacterized membrane protein YeaQ/YmgE (transglycosylase-associated protein family)